MRLTSNGISDVVETRKNPKRHGDTGESSAKSHSLAMMVYRVSEVTYKVLWIEDTIQRSDVVDVKDCFDKKKEAKWMC